MGALGPPSIPRAVEAEWAALRRGHPGARQKFEPASVDELPEPARRWLRHSIGAGTALWESVEITMTGQIRLNGSWRPFEAGQVLAPGKGFIWAARATVGGLPISGFDRYTSRTGEMRWKLMGVIPVVKAEGSDVTRSARGRLAGEGVLVPTSFRAARWEPGPSVDTVVMQPMIEPVMEQESEAVILTVSDDGALQDVAMERWGNPDGRGFGRFPFGVSVTRESTYQGVTITSVFSAGWWHGTEREEEGQFFRASIKSAIFR